MGTTLLGDGWAFKYKYKYKYKKKTISLLARCPLEVGDSFSYPPPIEYNIESDSLYQIRLSIELFGNLNIRNLFSTSTNKTAKSHHIIYGILNFLMIVYLR